MTLVLTVRAQSLLRIVSPFSPVTLLPFSTSFHPFLTHPLEDLFTLLFIHPAFPLHKWADLCIFESLFFLLEEPPPGIFWTGLSLLYSMFWKPLRVKLECSPHCPYRRALLHVWGRTPFIDSSPTDGHLGSPQKFAMTDNAVMDSLGHRYVHLVGSAPSEHPSRRGTVESKAHVCVVLPDFAQFPISTPRQCLRVHVSHKLTNRTYC